MKLRLLTLTMATLAALSLPALAQWSILAPGARLAPAGLNRYAFLVLANPLPGQETEFNEWYQNIHMGDLVSLPGWTGAQRFRLLKDVMPQHPADVYNKYGYVIVWDQQGTDAEVLHGETNAGNKGGRIRRGTGFDYSPGAGLSASYQALSARVTRPDGKGAFVPVENDLNTPRLNRYLVMDYSSPAAGVSDSDYEAALKKRELQVLALPGWIAAQTYRLVPIPGAAAPSPLAKYMIFWEIDAKTAQAAQDVLNDAVTKGTVAGLKPDPMVSRMSWWQPISPYIDRSDFQR